ncbi:Crp/Fnr family transcriptional regulator [Candidatus Viridilinea mediisalina]|uniref:Cyclic nucleotide-binding protein n=1 Tax=Candidatus Viridilinea mediisalina TaxID=2024553 RepID=A0A2A6RGM2_9CHLR|nr:Crp/Fnr family transcriptional regulator [Candidatus Viridilinea mediisalina]PDW02036.1 cyclic nucleotide-binding protein [Candidatus Viridilinea mediisalina]
MHSTPHSITGDIFRDLAQSERAEVERHIAYNLYPPGQVFHAPNEVGEHLFVLRAGRVRIYKLSSEGRALTLMLLEPVTIFGEMALVGQSLHDTFAETMSESTIGLIGRATLRCILERYPPVALACMELMGQRLRAMEHKLADIAFKSVPQRLASLLLSLAGVTTTHELPPSPPLRVVRYTHQQLADMVGSYRETITKALGELREAGIIRVEDDGLTLVDVAALQRIALR